MLQKINFALIIVVCFILIACKSSNQTSINKNNNVDSKNNKDNSLSDEDLSNIKLPKMDIKELEERVIYPEMAKRAVIEGTVIVRALIDKNGNVVKTSIEESDSEELNDAAVTAIKETKFTPAMLYGKQVAVWVSIPINFKLDKETDNK